MERRRSYYQVGAIDNGGAYGASIARQSIISRPTRACSTSIESADDGASKGKHANLNGSLAHFRGYTCQTTPSEQLLGIYAAGLIPKHIVQQAFSSIYFLGLWKDQQKTKMRAIGVGLAFRRILATIYAQQNAAEFAAYLLPYQYAIGIPNATGFIAHTIISLQVKRAGSRSADELFSNPPSRVGLFFDQQN
eukprot:scaffold174443_cov51-Attheya_sp.AAC.1